MKARIFLQFICLSFVLGIVSCEDDAFLDNRYQVEEGVPAKVQLCFQAEKNALISRAAQDEAYESRVDNIYIIVFDGAGKRKFSKFCTEGSGLSYTEGHNKGIITFETTSLNNARIVGIANLTTAITSTAYTITPDDLSEEKIKNLDDLKAMYMSMQERSIERYGLFMMTGYAKDKDDQDSETVTIPGGEGNMQTLNAILQLERTDAKIKFIVQADPGKAEWKNFSFLPKEWTVKRVPLQSFILKADEGDYDENAVYFNSPSVVFEDITRNAENANLYSGGSFVFYMPENKKSPKETIKEAMGVTTPYAQRESWVKEDSNGDKIFTNANENSTYVEMTGTLSYIDTDNQQVSADVCFTVHLGYASQDVNDYMTERNCFYTYTVKIRGIDDIIYEVEKRDDRRPGYEGNVVYSSDQIFEFDSHYDRRKIKLRRNDITDQMQWSVNTPFSQGIHEMEDEIPENMRDYRWIKFAINYDYNVLADQYVKYPGDQNYNDPYQTDESKKDQPSPYYSPGGEGYNESRQTQNARLLDINQLIERLQGEVKNPVSPIFDEDGYVTITVFVDENLYFSHPITNEPDNDNRSLWKLTADKEDRQMHIIAGGTMESQDGNSSIVHSKFSFKQRSIRTIFNVDKKDLLTAWGLESVMETGRMQAGKVTSDCGTSNGRLNTLYCILGKNYESNKTVKWTDILGTDDSYSLRGEQTALRACLLRNRDLNGDNVVDDNEIRWYLTSIDQLTDIYLGEYALDEKSRLYPSSSADRIDKNKGTQVRWHYTCSSSHNETATPWILWAEEGASRGSADGSIYDDGEKNELFSYRCARNLGLSLDNPDEIPAELISCTEENNSGYYLIDLTNMNPKSLRSASDGGTALPPHNERNANNRPYVKFRVHSEVCPNPKRVWDGWSRVWNTHPWSYYQTWAEYPPGYRIPNQRELLIMATRMPTEAWKTFQDDGLLTIRPDYVSQTAFSLNGKGPYSSKRYGFMWHSSNREFFLQNDKQEEGYVRPVQDVIN